VDNLPVLEMNLGERTSHLGAQFHTIDGRKLAEHAYSRVNVANEWFAYRHSRGWHLRWAGQAAWAMNEANPNERRERR